MKPIRPDYQIILEATLEDIKASGVRPKLLLHACCAPCSSYVIEYLSEYFDITLLYYNPNIQPKSEYDARANELIRLASEIEVSNKPKVVVLPYTPEDFRVIARGREKCEEGGERCLLCYEMRLSKTAEYAALNGFDWFSTTLTVGTKKAPEPICKIGLEMAEKYGVRYLISDFKRNGGNLRSCELSEKHGLYRQEYCGCAYSKIAN